jgi:hypothetical protein
VAFAVEFDHHVGTQDGVLLLAANPLKQLNPLITQADLEALARELDRSHPAAAASLREGLAETLTIGRLGVPPPWLGRFVAPMRSSR